MRVEKGSESCNIIQSKAVGLGKDMFALGEQGGEVQSVCERDSMQCPRCNSHVPNNTPVCIHCGAEIGVCVKCKEFSYFIDIDFSQMVEWVSASILLGILFNYSKVRFKKCATCKNSVQVCINCGKIFKGMNTCPHCQYSHFVGSYSIIKYLKSRMREQ